MEFLIALMLIFQPGKVEDWPESFIVSTNASLLYGASDDLRYVVFLEYGLDGKDVVIYDLVDRRELYRARGVPDATSFSVNNEYFAYGGGKGAGIYDFKTGEMQALDGQVPCFFLWALEDSALVVRAKDKCYIWEKQGEVFVNLMEKGFVSEERYLYPYSYSFSLGKNRVKIFRNLNLVGFFDSSGVTSVGLYEMKIKPPKKRRWGYEYRYETRKKDVLPILDLETSEILRFEKNVWKILEKTTVSLPPEIQVHLERRANAKVRAEKAVLKLQKGRRRAVLVNKLEMIKVKREVEIAKKSRDVASMVFLLRKYQSYDGLVPIVEGISNAVRKHFIKEAEGQPLDELERIVVRYDGIDAVGREVNRVKEKMSAFRQLAVDVKVESVIERGGYFRPGEFYVPSGTLGVLTIESNGDYEVVVNKTTEAKYRDIVTVKKQEVTTRGPLPSQHLFLVEGQDGHVYYSIVKNESDHDINLKFTLHGVNLYGHLVNTAMEAGAKILLKKLLRSFGEENGVQFFLDSDSLDRTSEVIVSVLKGGDFTQVSIDVCINELKMSAQKEFGYGELGNFVASYLINVFRDVVRNLTFGRSL